MSLNETKNKTKFAYRDAIAESYGLQNDVKYTEFVTELDNLLPSYAKNNEFSTEINEIIKLLVGLDVEINEEIKKISGMETTDQKTKNMLTELKLELVKLQINTLTKKINTSDVTDKEAYINLLTKIKNKITTLNTISGKEYVEFKSGLKRDEQPTQPPSTQPAPIQTQPKQSIDGTNYDLDLLMRRARILINEKGEDNPLVKNIKDKMTNLNENKSDKALQQELDIAMKEYTKPQEGGNQENIAQYRKYLKYKTKYIRLLNKQFKF